MSITITRSLARQVRSVFRRALGIMPRDQSFPLTLETDSNGLRLFAKTSEVAVEYRVPGQLAAETITVPFQVLADCEGRQDEPVQLESAAKDRVTAQWRNGNVPQLVSYDAAKARDTAEFPPTPENMAANPPQLLAALHAASQAADNCAVRYALDHFQLRGPTGTIAATDGRQLLLQAGFQFPWEDSILLPASKVFGCPELAAESSISIGRSKSWVTLDVGGLWKIHWKLRDDLRFPKVEQIVPKDTDLAASCRLSPADAQFLAQSLSRLPANDEDHRPLTLDLNGHVALRARSADADQATEVILANSTRSGEPTRFVTNRQYLARALSLGFEEVRYSKAGNIGFCQDAQRTYLWVCLTPDSAIAPSDNCLRIESPATAQHLAAATRSRQPAQPPLPPQRTNPVVNASDKQTPSSSPNGHSRPVTSGEEQPPTAIQQAEALRDLLRDAAAKAGDLLRALHQDKRQARQLRTALASLRQLQALDV